MSLVLIQGYSSAEEEEENENGTTAEAEDVPDLSDEGEEDRENSTAAKRLSSYKSVSFHHSAPPNASSGLPSAFTVFSQISGPPQFLNNCVEENASSKDVDHRHGRHARWGRNRKEKKDLPTGAVVEAKAQLVGIHERVRSDVESKQQPTSPVQSMTQEGGKRIATATNPSEEDSAELLRMCLQCGIPKTYTSARGMVCPVCNDRPPNEMSSEPKKKGSTIKDKEKSKRMRGQSSHATWKSETEMQLRQQFD